MTQPGAQPLRAGEVHLWWLPLAQPPQTLEQLAASLDEEETARAARFHFDAHRRRFIAAHGMMRFVLAAYAGVDPAALRFVSGARGKPALAGPATKGPLHFNLSHSDDEAVFGVSAVAALGVDIEVQRPLSDLEALARSHFSDAEIGDLYSLPEARRPEGFFTAWTRKEAYVKALGQGLAVPLDSFEVTLRPDEPAALRSIGGSRDAARAWTLWATRPTPRSWAAVAVQASYAMVRIFALG